MKVEITGWTLFGIWLGGAIGHYLNQAIDQEMWWQAIDRSYFQGLALFCVWIMIKLKAYSAKLKET
jgi:hypothetical protein